MGPPSSPCVRLARTTIAIAFQRISERMRHSICASPGALAPWPGGRGWMSWVAVAYARCGTAGRGSRTIPLGRGCAAGAAGVVAPLGGTVQPLHSGRVGLFVGYYFCTLLRATWTDDREGKR